MADATITRMEADTLTGIVDRDGAVKVSFFGLPGIPHLAEPQVAPGNGLGIASAKLRLGKWLRWANAGARWI